MVMTVLLTVPGTEWILNICLLNKRMSACRLVVLQLFPPGGHCQSGTQVTSNTCSEVPSYADQYMGPRETQKSWKSHWCFVSLMPVSLLHPGRYGTGKEEKKGEGWMVVSNSCSLRLGTSPVNLITLITYWISSCSMSYFPVIQYAPWE